MSHTRQSLNHGHSERPKTKANHLL